MVYRRLRMTESDDTGIVTYASGQGTSTAVSAPAVCDDECRRTGTKSAREGKRYHRVLASSGNKLASGLSDLLDDVADTAKYTSELTDSLEMLTGTPRLCTIPWTATTGSAGNTG